MRKVAMWAAVAALGLGSLAGAEDKAVATGDAYTLSSCAVSGEPLGSMGEPVKFMQEGREVLFCCSGCEPRFKADPAKYLAKIDAELIKDQTPHYPLTTDLVSGEPLPEAAKIVDLVHMNRLVRLGSQKSAQTFMKDPAPYLAKLDEAVIAKQLPTYPLDKCIVSGEKLGATDSIKFVVANRLVQFCCDHCKTDFLASPAKYIGMLDKGEAPAAGSAPHEQGGAHEGHHEHK